MPSDEVAESTVNPFRILLVDDQPMIHEALRRMLADADDIELHYCREGTEAVKMASDLHPSVILQDLVMPDIDGLMLVKFYNANEITRDIPVIVLSSKEDAKTKAEAFSVGANDYLVKLPDQIELLARIRYHAKAYAALLERNAALKELKLISITDGLTKLFNRRHFDELFDVEWKRSIREQHAISLIMIDIDHFKQFNDNYGHQAGDDCLVEVAKALQSAAKRPADTAARYGGEEFIVILANTDEKGALTLAENIRQAVVALNIAHDHSSAADHVTVSLGVASEIPSTDSPAERLLKAADQALYQAKEAGRNRTAIV